MPLLYKVRDKRRFLAAALAELAGDAQVSFEGNLSGTSLSDVAGASSDETQVLKRNTLWPKQDFIVLPLEIRWCGRSWRQWVELCQRVSSMYKSKKRGGSNLVCMTSFSPDSMFLGPGLTPLFIATLQEAGVLTHWTER